MVADTRRRGGNVGARLKGKSVVARKAKAKFDARAFLARANGGVTVSNYRRGQSSSPKATPRTASSLFKRARSKSRSSLSKARKQSLHSSKPEISSARVA
jgi:hypothetical protein